MQWLRAIATTRRFPDDQGSTDLRTEVAGLFHTVLHRGRAERGGLSASPVFCPGGVLRQSDLPPARRLGPVGRTAPGRQSHHRPTPQDHHHLRPQGDQTLPHYGNGFIKQYVRDHLLPRTELATNNVTDYGVKKAVENLPQLQKKMATINDNYLDVQQDILATFVDRGQLRKLAEPTVLANGKRSAHIAAGSKFSTREIHTFP